MHNEDRLMIGAVLLAATLGLILWLGAAAAALIAGVHLPTQHVPRHLRRLLLEPSKPSRAWNESLGGPIPYWLTTATVAGLAAGIGYWVWRQVAGHIVDTAHTGRQHVGLASRQEVDRAAGRRALVRRGRVIRPSLGSPTPNEVGYQLGRSRRRPAWVSAEDSIVVLGPPRSGKGLHLVIPMINDAPGAVVTTSTRPDNLRSTLERRSRLGPISVFDPQQLARGVVSSTRWSPVRGCERPQTAMIRARALAAVPSPGADTDFWQSQTESVLRVLLHSAALTDRTAHHLYLWSLSPDAAKEAVRALRAARDAAQGWADSLEATIQADPRTRDSIWLGVRTALSCLADPRVLDTVSPRPEEHFDPEEFLLARSTLYLLGTSSGAGAAANLIAAYVEDIVETARRLAADSPAARLDPPLALILDEVANYPLASLPSLMSEGGGSGITTVAVLQSLAQARARWGDDDGSAIWDSAIAKVILGGGSNARDLADLSTLIGEREEWTTSVFRGPTGARSTSNSPRKVPIMDTSDLRTLPFGTAILLLRSAPPIRLELSAWTSRR